MPRPKTKAPERPDTDLGSTKWAESRRSDKMAEKLARQITDDIIERKLQPGATLPPEAEMIKSYAVGRATLREALRLLEVQGLLNVKPGPGGGPVLANLSAADFARMAKLHFRMRGSTYREVLAARLAIEPLMARLAAEAQDKVGLKALRRAIELAEQADPNDESAWQSTSDLFHATIASISGNTVLDLLGMCLKEVYHTRPRTSLTAPPMRSKVLAVHRAIAEAIFAGDATEAERLMREHMVYYARRSDKLHSFGLEERIAWK